MESRNFQPSLLWVKVTSWYQDNNPEREFNPTDLKLYIYRTDCSGAYLMHGPKLYWTDEPMTGQYFSNCDQKSLEQDGEKLGEVVLYDRRYKKTVLIGKNFEQAIGKINE